MAQGAKEVVFLGEVDYFGQVVKAFRVVMDDCWKFVINIDGTVKVLITF